MTRHRLSLLLLGSLIWFAAAPSSAQAPRAEDGATTGGAEAGNEPRTPAAIAAAAYARGDWETAVAQYRAMVAEGYVDAALFYNLGTTYARAGDKGRAVWMLLRAARLDPRERSIWNNLGRLAPDLKSQMAFFPLAPLEAVFRSLRLNEWALIGGIGITAAAMACAVVLFMSPVHRRRNFARRIAWTGLAVGLTGHSFAAAKYYDEIIRIRGVVTDPETAAHAAPSDASEVYAFTLPPGTLIRIKNAGVEGWVRAVYGGKSEVFIRTGQFERL